MSPTDPLWAVLLALAAALALLFAGRRGAAARGMIGAVLVLVPCAASVAGLVPMGWLAAPLVAALVVAALAREAADPLPGECALKLLWVLGGALALSAVGAALIALATGVASVPEQWAVLRLGLSPSLVWKIAVPLGLLAGIVLLGGAPFHFWVADVFQGVPAAVAPLAVAAMQAAGGAWLVSRLAGVEGFPEGADLAGVVLRTAAAAALLAGAGTILSQRRPERRVGTLASLQGGLALAMLAATLGRGSNSPDAAAWLVPWAAHLALALAGAAPLARLTAMDSLPGAPGSPLFRRHPLSAIAGLYALFSLAGVPGTPGAALWLEVARHLVASGRSGLLVALALAWLTAFAMAMRELREGFGAPAAGDALPNPVPVPVRLALWLSGAGLAAVGVVRLLAR